MTRKRKLIIGVFTAVIVLCVLIRTPDTDPAKMHAKYGGDEAQYVLDKPGYTTPNQLNLHYRDQGNPDGRAVVFIHGSSASLHTWEAAINAMPQDYRYISLDLPGHGLTGPHPDQDYSADAMIDAVNTVLDKLEIKRATLVGNSMGGWVSWRYALKYPQRIDALVLVDATGIPTADKPPLNLGFRLIRNPITRPITQWATPRFMIKKSIAQTVYVSNRIDEDTVDLYWELLRYPGNRKATSVRAGMDRDAGLTARLKEITVPVLIVWGQHDQLVYVSCAQGFKDRIAHADVKIYDNAGHIPMEEIPQQFANDLAAFLRKTD